jgi:quercetin 2,3-dioxygenase
VRIYAALLEGAERATHALVRGRSAYVHMARGAATVNGQHLAAGDALKLADVAEITLKEGAGAEVLLFDLK